MALNPGLRGRARAVVGEGDTAVALGSGDVPVFGTPRLLALLEAATVAAVRDHLGRGVTSVGTKVTLEHRAASPVGAEIVATAELTEVAGGRLAFAVEAREGDKVIGRGSVERAVVDRDRFLARLGQGGIH